MKKPPGPSSASKDQAAAAERPACEVCGAIMPYRGGVPAKACRGECRKVRRRRIELERYYRKKQARM